jgi:putative tryptophan/tyrosine transport system substrate-binding protein
LIAYGTSIAATYPRAGDYFDRILKGATSAEMPFDVVTRQELVINQMVAHDLGMTFPADVLKRADRVME